MHNNFISLKERFAEDIIKNLKLKFPINAYEAVEKLGGKITYEEHRIIDFEEAHIIKLNNGNFEFKIIEKIKDNNFFIAILLGHLFLTMGYLIDEEKWKDKSKKKYVKSVLLYRGGIGECDALDFANAFIIPKRELFNLINEGKSKKSIQKYFNVSERSLEDRLKFLFRG